MSVFKRKLTCSYQYAGNAGRRLSVLARAAIAGGALLAMSGAAGVLAQESEGEKLLNARCASCHQRLPDGGLSRVSEARKTPEGWDMTLVRMMLIHGVKTTPQERSALVKHLADTQGMAPSETRDWRYILERRPNVVESPPDEGLAVMCGRCHSYARVALQRRDTGEWLKLSHFHLGQWPTIEYQALGRDRNWWEIASTDVPKKLGDLYPLNSDAWTAWQAREKADLTGTWRLVGHRPGVGGYEGTATVTGSGKDAYKVTLDMTYADGRRVSGEGGAIVYTGYEWRARLKLGEDEVLQVSAVSEDGNEMKGRWFVEDSDAIGANLHAVRVRDDSPQVLSVQPSYIKIGESAEIVIAGVGLSGDVNLGAGIVVTPLASDPTRIVAKATAATSASAGVRTVTVGGVGATGLFTVYDSVHSVRVEPDYAIARVGGDGGPLAPVPAQFDAVAYMNGPDGEPATDDDIRIGVMPAKWSADNFNETAAEMDDVNFVGAMQPGGLFMPAGAGPNPQRRFQTNNAGDLAVKAVVSDGGSEVEGSGHLVVTVQRWNDPPIR